MVLQQFSLRGRVALVTGAARGLGQGIAIGLAEAGARLFLIDIEDCTETEAAILALGGRCHKHKSDLMKLNRAGANHLVQEAVKHLGDLDILVNNAGIIRRDSSMEVSEQDWEQVLQINLNSVFYLSQAAANHFEGKGRGKIINMASMLSFQGGLKVASYTAAKSGVAGLTKALANEWAAKGINVNAIAPGYLATQVTAGIRKDPIRNQQILDRIPAGRWGRADDLKGVAVFLASQASDYMHGSIVPVDGGWLGR